MRVEDTLESLIRFGQYLLTKQVNTETDKTVGIACAGLFKQWVPGKYIAGDIRTDHGVPYESMIDHDSTVNPDWTIDVRSIWKPYHSRQAEWALPFVHPTGAHDIYKAGEYMLYIDGKTYLANQDTSFSPEEYPQAWEKL